MEEELTLTIRALLWYNTGNSHVMWFGVCFVRGLMCNPCVVITRVNSSLSFFLSFFLSLSLALSLSLSFSLCPSGILRKLLSHGFSICWLHFRDREEISAKYDCKKCFALFLDKFRSSLIFLRGKNGFAEISKNLDIDLKIILFKLYNQNYYVGRSGC